VQLGAGAGGSSRSFLPPCSPWTQLPSAAARSSACEIQGQSPSGAGSADTSPQRPPLTLQRGRMPTGMRLVQGLGWWEGRPTRVRGGARRSSQLWGGVPSWAPAVECVCVFLTRAQAGSVSDAGRTGKPHLKEVPLSDDSGTSREAPTSMHPAGGGGHGPSRWGLSPSVWSPHGVLEFCLCEAQRGGSTGPQGGVRPNQSCPPSVCRVLFM